MIQYDDIEGKDYRVTHRISRKTSIKPPQPIKDQFASLDTEGVIVLLPGFCYDGATGAVDTDSIMTASAFHDAATDWYNRGLLTKAERKIADQMFKSINKEGEMPSLRVKWTYQAVRKFFEFKEKIKFW